MGYCNEPYFLSMRRYTLEELDRLRSMSLRPVICWAADLEQGTGRSVNGRGRWAMYDGEDFHNEDGDCICEKERYDIDFTAYIDDTMLGHEPGDEIRVRTLDELQAIVSEQRAPIAVCTVCTDLETGELEEIELGEWLMFDGFSFLAHGIYDTAENYGKVFVAYY